MARYDGEAILKSTASLQPAARTASANGTGVDVGSYSNIIAVCNVGTRTDGTHTFSLEDSADNSSFAAVAAGDQIGTFSAITSSTQQQVVGYIGTKRYIRVVITVAGASTGALSSAHIVAAGARKQPV